MAAALAASGEGASVLLIERNHYLGGILTQCIHDGFGLVRFGKQLSGPEYAHLFAEQIAENKNINVLLNTMAIKGNARHELYCVSRDGAFYCNYKSLVLATGCRERTRGAITIPGSRPAGIYTAGVVQNLLNIQNIAVGKRAVILGSGDIGLIMARRLSLSGVEVVCVLEKQAFCNGLARNVQQCLDDFNIPLYLNRTVSGIQGKKHLESVTVSDIDEKGKLVEGSEYKIPCDLLILSVGLIPENEIASQIGVKLLAETNGVKASGHLETSVPGVFSCGNSLHVNDLVDNVSAEGDIAGKCAAAHALGKDYPEHDAIVIKTNTGRHFVPARNFADCNDRKNLTCVICPNSCLLSICKKDDAIEVENAQCSRGKDFAIREMTNPERMLTSTVKIINGETVLASVRSDKPVRKAELAGLVKKLDQLIIHAPVNCGQVIAQELGENKVNIIATRTIQEIV